MCLCVFKILPLQVDLYAIAYLCLLKLLRIGCPCVRREDALMRGGVDTASGEAEGEPATSPAKAAADSKVICENPFHTLIIHVCSSSLV